jgi:Leucine-rich repeat (LRR) protein
MYKSQSYHPRVIICDHFDNIRNQIDIETETLLENQLLTEQEINNLNDSRNSQIEKINEIEKINLDRTTFDEKDFTQKWSILIDDASLHFDNKIETIKESLIFTDCILIEDSTFKSNLSLWITPWFYTTKRLEVIRHYYKYFEKYLYEKTNEKNHYELESLDSFTVKSVCLVNSVKNETDDGTSIIKDLRLFDLTSLQLFNMPYCGNHLLINRVEKTAFKDLINLQELDIRNIGLSSLEPGSLDSLTSLRRLELKSLKKFIHVDSNIFNCLENLQTLRCLRLTQITPSQFKNLAKLKELVLFGGEICEQISLQCLDNLEELRLLDIKLASLKTGFFQDVKKLKTLSLETNDLTSLDKNSFAGLTQLEHLNLQYNKIAKIEAGTFDNLKKLKLLLLAGNPIGKECLSEEKPAFYEWLLKYVPNCKIQL